MIKMNSRPKGWMTMMLAAVAVVLLHVAANDGHAAIVFDADFDNLATNGDAVAVSDLNTGTATGSWSTTDSGDIGNIHDNSGDGDGSNKAFAFDENAGSDDNGTVTGSFSSSVDLNNDSGATVEFLWVRTRGGNNTEPTPRQSIFELLGDNSSSTEAIYGFTWFYSGPNEETVVDNNDGDTIDSSATNFVSANNTDDWNPGDAVRVLLKLNGVDDATVSFDNNNDGDFSDAGDVSDFALAASTANISEFTDVRFSLGNGPVQGNYIDDVLVTVIPAPAALPAGLALLGLAAMRRQRSR